MEKKLREEAGDGFGGSERAKQNVLVVNSSQSSRLRPTESFPPPCRPRTTYLDDQSLKYLLAKNSPETTLIFKEYFGKYRKALDAESQYRIASLLYREEDYNLASRTLEMLVDQPDTPEPLREQSMMLVAKLLEKRCFMKRLKAITNV